MNRSSSYEVPLIVMVSLDGTEELVLWALVSREQGLIYLEVAGLDCLSLSSISTDARFGLQNVHM